LAFTGFSVSSLAQGIGANIVVFTLFYTVLFDPLPYPEEERLLLVEETAPAWQIDRMGFSYPDLVDFEEQNGTFSHFAGFLNGPHTLTGRNEPERILGCQVSAGFLEVLGVQPIVGRGCRSRSLDHPFYPGFGEGHRTRLTHLSAWDPAPL
jgi:hypothetical protein